MIKSLTTLSVSFPRLPCITSHQMSEVGFFVRASSIFINFEVSAKDMESFLNDWDFCQFLNRWSLFRFLCEQSIDDVY